MRVLTFTQAWSGPFGTELLGLLGADVVQIESRSRTDVWRGAGRAVPKGVRHPGRAQDGANTSALYNTVNLNKRAITLDMSTVRGRELFWRLVPGFDVVVDNFSPHVMASWGVTLDTLRARRPDVIFASLSGYGAGGPLAPHIANGNSTEAMAGLASLNGVRGGGAAHTAGLIPDPITGYYLAAAVVAAACHRRATGEGQRVDVAMTEAVGVVIGDAVAEVDGAGAPRGPDGNAHPRAAPHGVYAAREGHIAVAAETDAAWAALAARAGIADARFAGAAGRKAHEAEVDAAVAAWLAGRDAAEEAAALGRVGVCAARVEPYVAAHADPCPQFRARGFAARVAHPEAGAHWMPLGPWGFARSPPCIARPAPRLGEHSWEVLRKEAGVTAAEFAELEALGVTGTTRLRARDVRAAKVGKARGSKL